MEFEPVSKQKNQLFSRIGKAIELCYDHVSVWRYCLCVFVMCEWKCTQYTYVRWQMYTVNNTIQISTHKTTQPFSQFN